MYETATPLYQRHKENAIKYETRQTSVEGPGMNIYSIAKTLIVILCL